MSPAPVALVYILDNQKDVREALGFAMNKFGVQSKLFGAAKEMLEAAAAAPPALFLIQAEFNDGTVNGIGLIKAMREKLGIKQGVVALCAIESKALMPQALEAGANDCLLKPLEKDYLAARLQRFLRTDEIAQYAAHFEDLPDGRAGAKITIQAKIIGIDELGVRIIGPHLLPKGTVFKLESDIIDSMAGKKVLPLVTVNSSELQPDGKTYEAYAEFDDDTELLTAVRRWLVAQVPG